MCVLGLKSLPHQHEVFPEVWLTVSNVGDYLIKASKGSVHRGTREGSPFQPRGDPFGLGLPFQTCRLAQTLMYATLRELNAPFVLRSLGTKSAL